MLTSVCIFRAHPYAVSGYSAASVCVCVLVLHFVSLFQSVDQYSCHQVHVTAEVHLWDSGEGIEEVCQLNWIS